MFKKFYLIGMMLMSRILFINSVCNGSTGTICKNLYKAAEKEGNECCIAYGRGNAPEGFNAIKIGNQLDVYMHALKARLFDACGFGSKYATKQFIKQIEAFKPDIIHLHNIHGYYINIEILFDYLKRHPEIKKIWTLHDCWAFTGHCSHYTYVKCEKWKTICTGNCPNKMYYPKTLFSNIHFNFVKKRCLFTGINNLILVSPSNWLMDEVKLSYLKNYPIKVINNGINTNIFNPVKSDLKEKFNILDKKVILCVASVWNNRKGLDTIIELSKILDEKVYKIVLIGLSKKQLSNLPNKIIGITKTENLQELVQWYSLAELFINPTLEDNFPTVNLEALACGTPVITYNSGGSPESAHAQEDTIIFSNDIKELVDKIKKIDLNYLNLVDKSSLDMDKMEKCYNEIYQFKKMIR